MLASQLDYLKFPLFARGAHLVMLGCGSPGRAFGYDLYASAVCSPVSKAPPAEFMRTLDA